MATFGNFAGTLCRPLCRKIQPFPKQLDKGPRQSGRRRHANGHNENCCAAGEQGGTCKTPPITIREANDRVGATFSWPAWEATCHRATSGGAQQQFTGAHLFDSLLLFTIGPCHPDSRSYPELPQTDPGIRASPRISVACPHAAALLSLRITIYRSI